MKAAGLSFASLLFCVALAAQSFEVPKNYKFDNAADYDTYEKDVIACVTWLESTPVNQHLEKRKEANAFLLKWISGSPKVHIELKPEIVTFMDNGDLLMVFLGSWAKYSLNSSDFDNKVNGITAGLDSVMDFYTRNSLAIPKNKAVEKYLKMKAKGTLTEYIGKNA